MPTTDRPITIEIESYSNLCYRHKLFLDIRGEDLDSVCIKWPALIDFLQKEFSQL